MFEAHYIPAYALCRYAKSGIVELDIAVPKVAPATWVEINNCETVHSIASMWLWLSFRFGDAFVGREEVQVCSGKNDCRYCITAKHSSNHVFHHRFEARSRTPACNKTMSLCWQEQGKCNPSFGSSIGYCMENLHGSEYWKVFECSEVIQYVLTSERLTRQHNLLTVSFMGG